MSATSRARNRRSLTQPILPGQTGRGRTDTLLALETPDRAEEGGRAPAERLHDEPQRGGAATAPGAGCADVRDRRGADLARPRRASRAVACERTTEGAAITSPPPGPGEKGTSWATRDSTCAYGEGAQRYLVATAPRSKRKPRPKTSAAPARAVGRAGRRVTPHDIVRAAGLGGRGLMRPGRMTNRTATAAPTSRRCAVIEPLACRGTDDMIPLGLLFRGTQLVFGLLRDGWREDQAQRRKQEARRAGELRARYPEYAAQEARLATLMGQISELEAQRPALNSGDYRDYFYRMQRLRMDAEHQRGLMRCLDFADKQRAKTATLLAELDELKKKYRK